MVTAKSTNKQHSLTQVEKALSDQSVEKEGDLKYIEDSSLDQLVTTQREPLTQGDKNKIRELRQRLLEEEEERIRRLEEERLRMEEEVRVTREEVELLKRKAEDAAQMKAEGDAARQKAAEERTVREREEDRARKEEEASQKREEKELTTHLQIARKRHEEEKLERHRLILEADRISDLANTKKNSAEREHQTKGPKQYKGCFGKCNNEDCRQSKEKHFESDNYCYDSRVLAAAVATATEELTQAKAAAAAVRKSFLAAEAKVKGEEETLEVEETEFAKNMKAKQEASAATAKQTAEVRAKEALGAAAEAKKEAEAKTKADAAAAAAAKKHAEVKADACAKAAFNEANTEEAFFKRAAVRAAVSGRVIGRVIYDSAVSESLIVGVVSRLEPDLSSSSFSAAVPGLPKVCFRAINLPSGLSLDAQTGVIGGAPDRPATCQITVTAFNSNGEISATIPFKIVAERAPSSLAFDEEATSKLIVGVEMKLEPKPGFVAGVPAAKFEAINAATLAARALEDTLRQTTAGTLQNAIQDVCKVHDEIEASFTVLLSHTARLMQLQGAISQQPHSQEVPIPGEVVVDSEVWPVLKSDLVSQSLEELEKELSDLKAAQRAAAKEEKYAEAEALKIKYDTKTRDVDDYKTFKSEVLDPLRACCIEIRCELERVCELAKTADTQNETIQRRIRELADSAVAVSRELEQASSLMDHELLWCKPLELRNLQGAALEARQEILQKEEDCKSLFAALMLRAGELWAHATQGQQVAFKQLTTMQELLGDTACKPLAMQQKVGTLEVQDLADQLQRVLESIPTRQMMELRDKASAFGESLTSLVSPSLDKLKKAPVMPQGVELNETTGEITATPTSHVTNCVFTVRASNASGECAAVVTLSAHAQIVPAGLSYASVMPPASEFAKPPQSKGLLLVGDPLSMLPSFEHAGLPVASFSVEPALPAGLTLNVQTGEIHGTPSSLTARRDYKVVMANLSGKTDFIVSLEVVGWERLPPKKWNVKMCQTWLKEDLEMDEGDMAHFVNVDGTKLVTLKSKADVASKFPSLKPGVQKLLAQNVSRLLEEKEANMGREGADAELEAIISQVKAAASQHGLEVQKVIDLDKFDADKLVMGHPPEAGLGIISFLNVLEGESALLTKAGRGLDAIKEEILANGTDEEKECLHYVLYEEAGSSEKTFQNGWKRDCHKETGKVLESRQVDDANAPGGKRGMRFSDFLVCAIAVFCNLSGSDVFALRYYTTAGFKGINWPLRDPVRREQKKPHKLPVLVYYLASAVKKLRAWAANGVDAQSTVILYRGMSNREIFDTFMEMGGTELAPMSTTADLSIALHYSQGPSGTISTLLWIRTESFMDRGVDLEFLSAFPHEKEFLYPPLSYLKPLGKKPIVLQIGSSIYQIVELKISM